MNEGIHAHPDWYQGVDATSSFEDFQAVAAKDPKTGCPSPCMLHYPVTSQVKYRISEPKPIIKGMAYGPSPELTQGNDLPNDDFTSEEVAVMWASWGRGDLRTISKLGANTVRLYGNDPRVNKRAFLDEAYRQGLDVIFGMSDWPYLQAPDSCQNNDFDCFEAIYDSYKQNLLNGLTVIVNGKRVYHPAVTAMIVLNEPELKFKHPTGDCKAVVSAVDGMLRAEKELGIEGNPIAFSVAYSLAQKFGESATGSMSHLWKCFMKPGSWAKYLPKNDVTSAYNDRWVNSFNTPTQVTMQRQLLSRYRHTEPWGGKSWGSFKGAKEIPIFIGEYHSPGAPQMHDLQAMFSDVNSKSYPYYLGYCFFEFQTRYDKKHFAAFEQMFGMYGLDTKCKITDIEFAGKPFSIRGLYPKGNLELAVASIFGGKPVHHECKHVPHAGEGEGSAPAPAPEDTDVEGKVPDVAEDVEMPHGLDDPWSRTHPNAEPLVPITQLVLHDHTGEDELADAQDETVEAAEQSAEEKDLEETEEEAEEALGVEFIAQLGADGKGAWDSAIVSKVAADFEAFAAQEDLAATMTEDELRRYKDRFFAAAKSKAKAMDVEVGSDFAQHAQWQKGISRALADELPVATKRFVNALNEAELGWSASVEDLEDVSMLDAKALMGYIHDPEIENTTLEGFSEVVRRLENLPTSFDTRKQWPTCAETIAHVRDQGKCGSCWAMATAGSMDGRLCISSGGQFSGPTAWTSAGYITSCYNMVIINGCQGGNPGYALARLKKTFLPGLGGVPTGNEHEGTCVPYFGSGDALSHFDGKNVKAPGCPKACTGKYERPLGQDKFFSNSVPTTSKDINDAKRALIEGGPIPMAFTVYQDLMAYKSGYYTRNSDKAMGGHATTLIGWENKDYLISANSWGTRWGENGLFKIKADCCGMSYFISQVSSAQKAYPLPSGPTQAAMPTQSDHRRRQGTGFFSKVKQALKSLDAPAEEEDTQKGVVFLKPDTARLHVLLTVSGLDCTHLDAATRTAVQKAATLAVVGKLSMVLPDGVVLDKEQRPDQVTVLPCGPARSRPSQWDCETQRPGRPPNGTSVAFSIALPPTVYAHTTHEPLLAMLPVLERRLSEALGWTPRVSLVGEAGPCYGVDASPVPEVAAAAEMGASSETAAYALTDRTPADAGTLRTNFPVIVFFVLVVSCILVFAYQRRPSRGTSGDRSAECSEADEMDADGRSPLMKGGDAAE